MDDMPESADDPYRLYGAADWEAIRDALELPKLNRNLTRRIVLAAQGFNWARLADASERRAEEREAFWQIRALSVRLGDTIRSLAPETAKVLQNNRTDEEEGASLEDLDDLHRRATKALRLIPAQGGTPRRARLQLVSDLANIWKEVLGTEPTLAYDASRPHKYYSPFLTFVRAVMRPFPRQLGQGVEADIRKVIATRKRSAKMHAAPPKRT